jgi:hypothetical protein
MEEMQMAEINTRIILRNDTAANWENSEVTLKKGESAVEIIDGKAKLKIATADGQTFANASYVGGTEANVFQVELAADETDIDAAIEAVVGDAEVAIGDIAIVKAGIAGDKKSYTSYVWDGANWAATDGNYSAANVYTNAKITLAGDYGQDSRKDKITSIGNLRIGDEIAAGTSMQDVLKRMLTQTLQPGTPTPPAATIKLYNGSATSEASAVEVGTVFTPRFSASLSAGSYTYGPATGITATGYTVSSSGRKTVHGATADTVEDSATTSTGTFEAFTVDEDTNYKVSVSISHGAGPVAEDNLGGASNPEVKIAAGSKTDDSTAVTGFRGCFYGYYAEKKLTPSALTSAQVRGLCTAPKSALTSFLTYDNTNKYYYVTTNKMQQMFFAAPKGTYSSVAVSNSTNGAPQTVTKITDVKVEGANGFAAANYDVWYVDNAGAESGETKFKVVIA